MVGRRNQQKQHQIYGCRAGSKHGKLCFMLNSFPLCHAKGWGEGTELYLNLNLLFEIKLLFPCRKRGSIGSPSAQKPCKCIVTLLAPLCFYPGSCVTLNLFFCLRDQLAFTPHPSGTLHTSFKPPDFIIFFCCYAETPSSKRCCQCVCGSFPACLVEASWGIDGQEMAQAALHRQNNGMSRQQKC